MDISAKELLARLREGEVTIVFLKADETERTLRGTLNEDLIGPEPIVDNPLGPKKPKHHRKRNPEVQVIYDLDANEWRSFRWDSLVSVESS